MHYVQIIFCGNEEEELSCVKCLVNGIQEQTRSSQCQSQSDSGADSILIGFCQVDHLFQTVVRNDSKEEWTTLNSINIDQVLNESEASLKEHRSRSSEDITQLSDFLHDLADNLPYAGLTLDVYLISPNIEKESCTPTVGALMRLREWHSARVIIMAEPARREDDVTELLCDVLHADFFTSGPAPNLSWPVWRGPLSWPGERGFVQQGMSLECKDEERLQDKLSDLHFWKPVHNKKKGQTEGTSASDLLYGRQLEVLACVSVASVPLYMIDSFNLFLYVDAETPFGKIAATLTNTEALLLRLALFEKHTIPAASSHGLSTAAWKDGIAAFERPAPDPEKGPLPCRQHLFLLLIGQQDVTCPLSAIVLRSPSEVSPDVFEEIHQASYFTLNIKSATESQRESVRTMHKAVQNLSLVTNTDFQVIDDVWLRSFIQCVNKRKNKEGEKVKVTAREVVDCIREGQETFLRQGKPQDPREDVVTRPLTDHDFVSLPDLDCMSAEWPERRALLKNESKAKVLRRYQSNESCGLMLSSPLAPDESSMDAKDMVKWFKPDGNAVQDNLSPVKAAVRTCRLSSLEETNLQWPDCKNLQYHDVYYEHIKKSEKQEKFFQKFRDNIILEESHHVCSDNPHVPALRYRNPQHRSQMDISCGGSKLTPITRSTLSPKSMLLATPSAKRRLSKDGSQKTKRPVEGHGDFCEPKVKKDSKRSIVAVRGDEDFSAPKNRMKRDRLFSSQSDRSVTRKESSKEHLSRSLSESRCGYKRRPSGIYEDKKSDRGEHLSASLSQERKSRRDRHLNEPCLLQGDRKSERNKPQSESSLLAEKEPGRLRLSTESLSFGENFEDSNSKDSESSLFYPPKSDSTLPPFRRLSKPSTVSIFNAPDENTSDSLFSQKGSSSSKTKRLSVSSEEDAERRQSTESMDSTSSSERSRRSRSERHKRTLERVVGQVLEEAGVTSKDSLFSACFPKLFAVTKFFVKQLPSSHNLKEEMRNIAVKQVEQVVDLERRREDLGMINKMRKSSQGKGQPEISFDGQLNKSSFF